MVAVDDIVPQTKALLERYKTVRDNIVQSITPETACFQNTIKPLIDVENGTNGNLGVIAMLQYASPIPEARQASEEAVALMGMSTSSCRAREDIHLLFKAVHDRGEDLDAES
jgi:metallopeptidase MepB